MLDYFSPALLILLKQGVELRGIWRWQKTCLAEVDCNACVYDFRTVVYSLTLLRFDTEENPQAQHHL